jgi:hypothetical protein
MNVVQSTNWKLQSSAPRTSASSIQKPRACLASRSLLKSESRLQSCAKRFRYLKQRLSSSLVSIGSTSSTPFINLEARSQISNAETANIHGCTRSEHFSLPEIILSWHSLCTCREHEVSRTSRSLPWDIDLLRFCEWHAADNQQTSARRLQLVNRRSSAGHCGLAKRLASWPPLG